MKYILTFLAFTISIFLFIINSAAQAPNTWTQKNDVGFNVPNGSTPRRAAVGFSIGTKGYIGTGEAGVNYKNDFWEYDPSLNTWSQKANFGGTARYLAVGFSIGTKGYIGTGYDGSPRNDLWEYDPSSNTWSQKADFGGTARYRAVGFSIGTKGYIGTGTDIFSFTKDFWEYDPSSNLWNQKANFGGTAREFSVGFSIGTKGYIGTGSGGSGNTKDFWEYDPSSNLWSQKANFGGAARNLAVGFSIGTKGYIGTGHDGTISKNDLWEYDPSSNAWSQKSNFTGTARYLAVGFGIGTKGYLGTGFDGAYNNDLWEFDPSANSWSRKANLGETARYAAVGFSIGTKGYIGTGHDNLTDYKNDFWEYDQSTGTWSQKANFGGTARELAVGFSIGTKGYIGTGYDVSYSLKNDFWEYDPSSNTWSQKANFGGGVRDDAVGFSIGTKGYIGTGYDVYTSKNDFWEYDPSSNTWSQKANFGGTARGYAVGFSIGTKGYIGTGHDGTFKNDFWEYDPSSNSWSQKANFGGSARHTAVGFSIGTKGYLGTGYDGSSYKNDFWEFDPSNNTWSQKANFGGTARYLAVGFSIGTKGYIGTGLDASGYRSDFWEYTTSCTVPSVPGNTTPLANQTICSGHTTTLSASGTGTLGWYSAASGGTYLGGGNNYTTPALSVNTTYYVQDSTCAASATRTSIIITVIPTVGTPTAITISAGTEPACQLINGTTTTTYATTSTNNTGYNWSLSNSAAGSIGATTGVMIWANGFSGTVNIQVTANGCNGPSAQVIRTVVITPTVGTPTAITISAGTEPACQLINGTTTTTYATTATNNTGYNWSLSNSAAGSIGATTGVMTWANGFLGNVDIRVTANGCNGPSAQVIRTVVITPTVGTPTAISISVGTEPACQLTNGTTTITYATTATNNTGFNWSLSNGLAGVIGATTGVMTWANGFSGTVNIQVTANGCNGPSAQVIRTVTVTPTVGIPTAISISAGTEPTCQLTNGTTTTTYATTATNNTSFNWSLSNGAAGVIGATTGVMTWANGFSGTVNIQVTANGCNGPSAQVIRTVTVTPTVGIPTAITISAGTEPTCQLTNGTTTTTYTTTSTNNTGFNWSLSNGAAGVIGATTGVMTWANGFAGIVNIQVTANGCNGPSAQVIRTVTVTPTVGIPVFSLGSTSTRCQGPGTVNYTATATNNTGITYTLDAASLAAGITINGATGTVTYVSGWVGVSMITATATGCNGTSTAFHLATTNPRPGPTITGPASVCIGSTGNVYTTQAGMSGYTWTVSAGGTLNTGAGTNAITVTWSTAGAQTVSVNYTNGFGCPALVPTVFNVTVNTLPVPSITGPTPICMGSTGNVYTTQAGMTGYTWTVSAGGTITTGAGTNAITVTWNTVGAQTVSVSYTNANGCTAAAPTVFNVTVNALPVPTITGQSSMCINSGNYNYTTESGMTNYVWNVSAGGVINFGSGTNQIDVSWIASGAQTVSVSYTNGIGCTAATPTVFNVTVNPLPNPAGTITGTASVCAGANNVTYSVASIPNTITYIWTLPPNATIASGIGTNSITVNYGTNALSGNIFVYGNNICGNGTSSPPFAVTVAPLPVSAGNITGPASVCQGAAGVVYTVPAIAGATGYTWTVPAGATIVSGANINSITIDFSPTAVSGNITVLGTNSCGNGTVSPNFAVTVNAVPPAPVISALGDILTSNAPTGNQWYFEGTAIAGATGQTWTAQQSGWYWDIVTINGCSSDTSNHIYILMVGIEQQSAGSNVVLYPNPNEGAFTLMFTSPKQENYDIRVYNNLGVQIFAMKNLDVMGITRQNIDLSPIPNGVYSIVISNYLRSVVKKIVINK